MRADIDPKLDALSERIIGAAFAAGNALGHGFLEAAYRNALAVEFSAQGLKFEKEKPFPITYRNERVGLYFADLVVEGTIIVELKAVGALSQAHSAQVLNYLKASGLPVGLLLNFGKPRIEVRRILLKPPGAAGP